MRVMAAVHRCGAASLILGIACWAAPLAAASCPAGAAQITLDASATEPTIDNDLTQPALQALAGGAHHQGRTQGLYRAEFALRSRIDFARTSQGDGACVWIEKLAVELAIVERKIYVVRKRRPGSCAYESVLAHERKHQAVDDALMREETPLIRQELEAALAALPPVAPVPPTEEHAARARLATAVKAALARALKTLDAERKVRQAAIDTPLEYRRVAAACG